MIKALSLSVALAISTVAILALLPQSGTDVSQAPAGDGGQVQDPSPRPEGLPEYDDDAVIVASFEFHPQVLNLKGGAQFVSGFLSLPVEYSVADVYVPSVMLNGAVYADTSFWMHNTKVDIQDRDKLVLKFDREEVRGVLLPGDSVRVIVTGCMCDGTTFVAVDYVTVQ